MNLSRTQSPGANQGRQKSRTASSSFSLPTGLQKIVGHFVLREEKGPEEKEMVAPPVVYLEKLVFFSPHYLRLPTLYLPNAQSIPGFFTQLSLADSESNLSSADTGLS